MKIRDLFRSATILSLLIALAAVTAACGGGGSASNEGQGGTEGQTTAEVEPGIYCGPECQKALELQASADSIDCTVGLSWNSAAHPYGAQIIESAEQAKEEFFPNMQLYVGDGRGESSTQTSQVSDFLARGMDTLIISPTDANALAPAVNRAKEQSVDVIAADRDVDADVLSFIGPNNVEAGRKAGEYIAERLDEGGVVEISGSPGASPTIDRNKGFMEVIESNPQLEVIASQSGNYNRAEGLQVMEDVLQRFSSGEIDAVFAHNDEMALGAIQAIKEAGREDEIFVIGVDGQENAFEAIESGDYAATVVYPLVMPEALIASAKTCAGEELPEEIELETPLVTEENVDKYKGTTF